MLTELASKEKVVGLKQSRRAIREGRARQVYLACDADPDLTEPLRADCLRKKIPVNEGCTMAEIGRACGIAVGAAVAAVL